MIAQIPAAIMAPFQAFFDTIVGHLEEIMQDALGDLFEYFQSVGDNTDLKIFSGPNGYTDSLPVSFNCIALKPGVTINLSACLVRIEDQALDAWRLETFDRLSQAFYQLEADYAAQLQGRGFQAAHRGSPGLMRQQEHEVIKVRVMEALHRKFSAAGSEAATLGELQLFEHAIDWENVSYRLFNYGPRGSHVAFEKLGLYAAADVRRKTFMNATWSQVLIPLREDQRLEQIMLRYLDTGTVDFEADLLAELTGTDAERLDELTAVYRDLVLQRQSLPVLPPRRRQETIPTDLMVIYEPRDGEPFPVSGLACPVDEDAP